MTTKADSLGVTLGVRNTRRTPDTSHITLGPHIQAYFCFSAVVTKFRHVQHTHLAAPPTKAFFLPSTHRPILPVLVCGQYQSACMQCILLVKSPAAVNVPQVLTLGAVLYQVKCKPRAPLVGEHLTLQATQHPQTHALSLQHPMLSTLHCTCAASWQQCSKC